MMDLKLAGINEGMDRLRYLIWTHSELLGKQPVFESLINQLNEHQANKLACKLVVFVRLLKDGGIELESPPTLH